MNKELKLSVFDIPQNILDKINHTVISLNGEHFHGLNRAKKLLQDKKVKYGQLKRIIHDLQNIYKINDRTRFDLCGGELMEKWANTFLDGERQLVRSKKLASHNINNNTGMNGLRKNPFRKVNLFSDIVEHGIVIKSTVHIF